MITTELPTPLLDMGFTYDADTNTYSMALSHKFKLNVQYLTKLELPLALLDALVNDDDNPYRDDIDDMDGYYYVYVTDMVGLTHNQNYCPTVYGLYLSVKDTIAEINNLSVDDAAEMITTERRRLVTCMLMDRGLL